MKLWLRAIPLFIIYASVLCEESDEEMIKKTKVLACIAITKARMAQDTKFIGDLVNSINKMYEIEDGRNKVVSLCLVNCYGKISQEKAFEIITEMHGNGQIDSTTDEHKRLVGLQDTDASAKELNKESFMRDFQEINKVLKELNNEHEKLKSGSDSKKSQSGQSGKTNQKKKSESSDDSFSFSDVLFNFLKFFFSAFFSIFNIIEVDNFFGIGLMIVLAFIILNFLKNMFTKPKKKRAVNNQTSNVEQDTRKEK